jgi:hypothetical protein
MSNIVGSGGIRAGFLAVARRGCLAAACLSSGWLPEAVAQQRPGGPQPQKLAADEGKGTIEAIGPGMLRLKLKGGNSWLVLPAPNAKIAVEGTAAREMLQPGQFVSCAVSLDEFGKAAEPVMQVIFPGGGAPGVVAGGLGIAEAGAKRVAGKRPAGTYLVSGTIKQVEDEAVTVQVGRERFELQVPADAALVVKTTNVALAAAGDEVEVEGLYRQPGELQATLLSIRLAKPVAPPPAKPRPGRRPAAQPAAAGAE